MNDLIFSGSDSYAVYGKLIIRRDTLIKEARILELDYIRRFGKLIEKAFTLKIECIKRKKMIAFCQMKVNGAEDISRRELDEFIEEELEDYYNNLADIVAIRNEKVTHITEYELTKVKKCYRKIASLIHPDINNMLFKYPEIQELWRTASVAYSCNDLETLEQIEVLAVQAVKEFDGTVVSIHLDDIDTRIEKVRDEINKIVSTDPYQYKFVLDNPEAIKTKEDELADEIETYGDYIKELDKILENYDIPED